MNPDHRVARAAQWKITAAPPGIEGVILKKNTIAARIAGGIAEHFPVRVSEWIMTYAMLGWGYVLYFDPETFARTPSLGAMANIADEYTWSLFLLGAGYLRLIGLTVNGTFRDNFSHSPHFRGLASLIACFLWGQITLGVLVSYFTTGGSLTGFVIYSAAMMTDCWNLFRAWADVGSNRKRTG